MKLSELTHPYHEICDNCHREIVAFKAEDGRIKYRCPDCGTRTIKTIVTKNHIIKDIRRPRC